MKIVTSVLKSLVLVTALFSFSLTAAFAQSAEEGEKLYNANCTSCHAINEKVVGPALKNVHTKRKEVWLLKWIKNSQALIKSGDADAIAIYKENNESVMTSFENLSDNQIKSINRVRGRGSFDRKFNSIISIPHAIQKTYEIEKSQSTLIRKKRA
jgi:cytochrome c551/c552